MRRAISDNAVRFKTAVLTAAPLTIDGFSGPTLTTRSEERGSIEHRGLFADYAAEADEMAVVALAFWESLMRAEKTSERSEQESARAAWMRRPAGPASYPGVVALV